MKRALKILLATLAGLVGLIVLAVVSLPLVIDPNDYRADIERLAAERTGRELTIDGPMALSVFPWLGAEINRVTLGNPPGFGPEPFARVAAADVRVRLWPLLWGEVAIGKVVLHGAELNLARDAQGRTNWADLTAPAAADEPTEAPTPRPEPPPDTAPEGGPPAGALAALTMGGLEVRDARVSWRDATTGARYRATEVDLTSGALRMGEPFPVDLALRLASNRPELGGTVQLTGEATVDPAAGRYALAATRLTTDLGGPVLPGGALTASVAADLAADLSAGTARVTGLDARAYGARVEGALTVTELGATPGLDGRLTLTAADGDRIAGLLADLAPGLTWDADALAGSYLKASVAGDLGPDSLTLEDLEGTLLGLRLGGGAELRRPPAGPVVTAELDGEVTNGRHLLSPLGERLPADLRPAALNGARLAAAGRLDSGAGRAELSRLTLQAVGAELRATAGARGLTDAPAASGHLALAPFSPRQALRALGLTPPATADPQALARASLTTDFAADTTSAALTDLTATLDDARLTGRASLPAFAGPTVRFDLALNGIDADRYLPPPSDGEPAPAPPPATPGGTAAAGAGRLPMELLRRLDISGALDVGRLRIKGLRLSDIRLRVDGRDGRLRAHPLAARLYGGRYEGDVRLDATGDTPRLTLDERLAGVAIGPLLNDAVGKAHLTGRGDVSADLSLRLGETRALLRSLDGRGSYTLRDGAVAGVNLERALTAAYAALGKADAAQAKGGGTRFRKLSGSARIEQGRLKTDDLALQSALLSLSGGGQLDLAEARVDYQLAAEIGAGAPGDLADLQGLTVPLRVRGPVTDPGVTVDLAGALRERAEQRLQQEKEKAKEKLDRRLEEKKEELRQQLEEKAKDLFKF